MAEELWSRFLNEVSLFWFWPRHWKSIFQVDGPLLSIGGWKRNCELQRLLLFGGLCGWKGVMEFLKIFGGGGGNVESLCDRVEHWVALRVFDSKVLKVYLFLIKLGIGVLGRKHFEL
ncbi:hypothetical protein PanWU01x14_361260 [Parasponia andersonii]|uniref:Uncharacterized protein n=1 Tax=Parasponia andersonii TaxID=3476 RepID=A0A2P5A7E4_PARAD|nr:hypothetical protein PanWU01x14_361260 [Parasponia andersonii]